MEEVISKHRFKLKLLGDEDFKFVNDLYANPEIMAHIAAPLSEQAVRELFDSFTGDVEQNNALCFVILCIETFERVGLISAKWNSESNSIETGTIVSSKFQNQGVSVWAQFAVMNEAKKYFPFKTCTVYVAKDNAAANASCRRIGFQLVENTSTQDKHQNLNRWDIDLRIISKIAR